MNTVDTLVDSHTEYMVIDLLPICIDHYHFEGSLSLSPYIYAGSRHTFIQARLARTSRARLIQEIVMK